MKKRILGFVLALAVTLCMLPVFAVGAAGITPVTPKQGDGSAENPYRIGTAAELYGFAKIVNDGNNTASGVLTADITVNKNVLDANGRLNGSNFIPWTPIGYFKGNNDQVSFKGTFDGQGHTVSGLYFYDKSTSYVGLFGMASVNTVIKNVKLADSYIEGKWYVGGICGYVGRSSTIYGCSASGKMKGEYHVGGICGGVMMNVTIFGCSNAAIINGTKSAGGICGNAEGGSTVYACYNTGTVSGDIMVGGVVGETTATYYGCYNRGNVSGNQYVGSFVGSNIGTVDDCYYLAGTANAGTGHYGGWTNNMHLRTAEEFKNGSLLTEINGALNGRGVTPRYYQGTNGVLLLCLDHKFVNKVCTVCALKDIKEPVIDGITNDGVYCVSASFTVSDPFLDTVQDNNRVITANGGKYTLNAGRHTIFAEDKAGNAICITVTVNADHTFGSWQPNGDGTHTRKCSVDAQHTESGNCTGGTAACTEKAKCELCRGAYGNLAEHPYSGDWSSNEQQHWHACTACTSVKDTEDHKDADKNHNCDICGRTFTVHAGGTATCKDKAICETCKAAYGSLDPKNHANLKHVPAKAATTKAEGNTEYWYCDGCDKYFADAAAEKAITKESTVTAKLPEEPKSPQTGDGGNIMLWLALLFVNGGVCTAITVKGKKAYGRGGSVK